MRIWFLAFLALVGEGQSKLIRVPLWRSTRMSVNKGKMYSHLTNTMNVQYYANIRVGTPPQFLTVLIDTGSSDLWLASRDCYTPICGMRRKYDSSKSTTYKENGKIVNVLYHLKKMQGFLSIDTINIGGEKIENQAIAEATNLAPIFENLTTDGVLGLDRRITNFQGETTLLRNMVKQRFIGKPVFSLYLKKNNYGEQWGEGSEIIFGGLDTNRFNPPMHYIPLIEKYSWLVKLDSVTIGGQTFCRKGCTAIVDSSIPVIGVPRKQLRRVLYSIGPHRNASGRHYVTCLRIHRLPVVSFKMNNITFTLTGKDYVHDDGGRDCYAAFGGYKLERKKPTWILGNVFLRKYYSVFDAHLNQIAFAEAK